LSNRIESEHFRTGWVKIEWSWIFNALSFVEMSGT